MIKLIMFHVFWLIVLLKLIGCQHLGHGDKLQAENPVAGKIVFAVPPSQHLPAVGQKPVDNSDGASLKKGLRAFEVYPNTASEFKLPELPRKRPDTLRPLPIPDLPSLKHLFSRQPEPIEELSTGRDAPLTLNSNTVRAALLVPLSGSKSDIGKEMMRSAQLAVFDFADEKFELLPIDTKGTSKGAKAAASKAIADGARIILGPLLADSVRASAPAARGADVPMLAFSSDRRVGGDGIYTLGFLPEEQVRKIVSFAVSRGIKNFAILAPDNAYGATVSETLHSVTHRLGAKIVATQFYDNSSKSHTDAVRELADYDRRRKTLLLQRKELRKMEDEVSQKALRRLEMLQTIGDLPFDALIIADGGKRLQSVAALLPFYDIDPEKVRILGTGQWDVPGLGAEPALLGAWFAAPDPSARKHFVEHYRKAYGTQPKRIATLAYDAVALAAVQAQAEPVPDFSEMALTRESGFNGRDGIFRLLPSGVVERGLAVMQVLERDAKVIKSAPKVFQARIN